jgi:iron-sulfur cluster assembly protein
MLTVTPKAGEKIRNLVESEGKAPERVGLRVRVEGGGCSGFQYVMDLTDRHDDDNVFEEAGGRVYVDPKSMVFIGGSVLDYVDALTGAGFTIRNPQSTGTCGCGMSFSV